MKKVGFIGTGSMGTILIESFLEARAVEPGNLMIMNRTAKKALELASLYKGVTVALDSRTVVSQCDWIFLCVKPVQMIPIIKEVNDLLTEEKTIVSITSPILTEELEEIISSQVVRFIPSIVNRALDGPSLVTFGKGFDEANKIDIMNFFKTISRPEIIEDSITRVASDLGSCGPAFLSFLLEKMIKGAVEETKITEAEAVNIVESMIIGYGEILKKKHFTLKTLQERVTVPGGVTGVGLNVLRDEVGNQFNLLFQKTHEKYEEDRYLIKKQLQDEEKSEE